MSLNHAPDEMPNVSSDETVSNDLVKQVRKLRWIGMDVEARLLQSTLRRMQAADVVLGVPSDTD
jgi:hypothetical protein